MVNETLRLPPICCKNGRRLRASKPEYDLAEERDRNTREKNPENQDLDREHSTNEHSLDLDSAVLIFPGLADVLRTSFINICVSRTHSYCGLFLLILNRVGRVEKDGWKGADKKDSAFVQIPFLFLS